jgi:hypothetical protein
MILTALSWERETREHRSSYADSQLSAEVEAEEANLEESSKAGKCERNSALMQKMWLPVLLVVECAKVSPRAQEASFAARNSAEYVTVSS